MSKERILKSTHNQEFIDRVRAERKLRRQMKRKGLTLEKPNNSVLDIEELRAQRKKRLEGVTIYRRESIPEHIKRLFIKESNDCA